MIFSAHFYVTSHPPPQNAITWLFRYKNCLCQTACWAWVTFLISSLQPPCEVGIIILSHLQIKTLRFREVTSLSRVITQSRNLNPKMSDSSAYILSTTYAIPHRVSRFSRKTIKTNFNNYTGAGPRPGGCEEELRVQWWQSQSELPEGGILHPWITAVPAVPGKCWAQGRCCIRFATNEWMEETEAHERAPSQWGSQGSVPQNMTLKLRP